MADNTTLNSGTGGDIIASASLTFSGDTAKVQCTSEGLLTGSEGSWTYTLLVGGAGAVGSGVQRVTLASDDPAVTSLQLLDDAVFVEDVGAQAADKGISVLAVRRDNASSMVNADNDYTNLIVDGVGRLHVNVGNTIAVGTVTAVTTVSTVSTVSAVTNVTNLDQMAGATIQMGTGVRAAGCQRVTICTDDIVPASQSGTWNITNISGTVSLPTGAASATNQTTIIGHLDGVEGLLTTIDADTGSMLTALQLLDDAVYAEDVAAQVGDKGVAILAVRRDADTSLVGADNDYANLQVDANGYLKVEVFDGGGSHTVDNNGIFAVQVDGAALTSLQLLDDIVVTEDAVHSTGDKGVMALAVRRDSAASSTVADGDYATLNVDANGRLYVGCDTHAVTQSGTWNVTNVSGTVSLPTGASTAAKQPALGTAGTASADVITIQGIASMTKLLVTPDADSAVNISQMNGVAVTMGNGASGTGVQRVTLANDSTGVLATVSTVTTCSTVTTLANGQTAHDSAVSGSPLRIGAKAETALSGIALVADGDATDLHAGVDGVLITRPHCNLEDVVQERTTNTDGASTAFASGLAAPGSGVRLWIKNVTICNSSASFCTVDLRDGSAGSVLWTFPVPATGGVTHNFDPPLKLTANTALAYDASAATTTLSISANGFKSKV